MLAHLLPLAMLLTPPASAPCDDPGLLTVAEASDFDATSYYDDVDTLLERLAAGSPNVHLTTMGTSHEGRSIPLAIVADPPVRTPADAHASDRAIVYVFGNIHAGEVCGKEALCMLVRDFVLTDDHPWLRELIVLVAPIYNPDGNERMAPGNRPGQVGPSEMGQRPNAQGLDLNRDHVKLESPEARAQAALLRDWNPHLVIDTHTTNGSRHRYTLTYAAPQNPSGHPAPIDYVRDELLPTVGERLLDRTGYDTFFYGNFDADHRLWRTYSSEPRFGGPYRGLRGCMSILSEAYSYATYRDRVLCTYEFVREILDHVAADRDNVIEIVERARLETIAAGENPQPDDVVGIRHQLAANPRPVTIRGYELVEGDDQRLVPGDTPADHPVVHLGRFEATRNVRRPFAYVLEPGLDNVADNLRAHGVEMEPFTGTVRVETWTVRERTRARRAFQGHRNERLECDASIDERTFPEGSLLIRTGQPLGNLIVYLLEPESQDGLVTWNFLDDHTKVGSRYPIHRIAAPADLP